MRTAHLIYLKCLVVVSLAAVPVRSEAQPLSPRADSIETTVVNADLVFIAKILKFSDGKPGGGSAVHDVTFAIEEVLKKNIFSGETYPQVRVDVRRPAPVLEDWRKRSCRLLVASKLYAPPSETTVIELEEGGPEVMTADLKLLRDPQAVLRAAREALRRMSPAVKRIHIYGLHVPRRLVRDTRWDKYYDTSGHLILNVPVDAKLERRAQRYLRSRSPQKRAEGARALRYFKSDENIDRLKRLYDDPSHTCPHRSEKEKDELRARFYSARYEAEQTLQAWGVDPATGGSGVRP